MKKIQVLFALVFMFFMYSCNSEQAEIQQDLAANVAEPSIEQQILEVHNVFLELRKTDPTISLDLKMVEGKLVSKIGQEGQSTNNGRVEATCKGDGYAFAKCVKEIVDKYGRAVITTCAYCAEPCEP